MCEAIFVKSGQRPPEVAAVSQFVTIGIRLDVGAVFGEVLPYQNGFTPKYKETWGVSLYFTLSAERGVCGLLGKALWKNLL
jgi:hypothetical protein